MSAEFYDVLRWLATGILWLLIGLFLASIVVAVYKWVQFNKILKQLDNLHSDIAKKLSTGDIEALRKLNLPQNYVGFVLKKAILSINRTPEAMNEAVEGEEKRVRVLLESGLSFLGTLGANAPFIGLFGTVLGIMAAFHDLAIAGHSGPAVVMAGLSEALIATAVGLLVAIPDVAMFNILKAKVRQITSRTEAIYRDILAYCIDHFDDSKGAKNFSVENKKVVRL